MAPLSTFFRRKSAIAPDSATADEETQRHQRGERRATEVQQQLLTRLPTVAGWDLGLCYRACDAVGGDLVDCLPLADGRLLITVGDVAGHGTQAALIAVSARKAIHSLVDRVDSLANLVVNLNEDIRRDCLSGQFLAAVIGILDPQSGRLVSCCTGAHSALLVDPDGPVHLRRLRSRGMALGVVNSEIFAKNLTLKETTINPGSTVVLYTDGINEARNADDEEFGEEAVMASLMTHCRAPAQAQVDALLMAGDSFSGGRNEDDVTILALRRLREDEEPDPS